MKIMEVALKILYGSQNYHLDGPDSDKDYKLIVIPSYTDLFYELNLNAAAALPTKYDKTHYSTMDIRQWHNLMLKGNVNALEYLFSKDIEKLVDTKDMRVYLDVMRNLMWQGYLTKVWDSFFSSVQGVALNAIKRNGVNPKTASRALYYNSLIVTLVRNNFRMDENTWRDYDTWKCAYRVRYKGEFKEEDNTEVMWRARFEFLKDFAQYFVDRVNTMEPSDYLKEIKLVNFLVRDLVKGEMFHE